MALIPPRRDEFLTPDGRPTLRFIKWIESVTTETNTTTTETNNINVRESFAWDITDDTELNGLSISGLYGQTEKTKEFRAITVNGGSYTALDRDFVNAKSAAIISFPQYPVENAAITIRNGDGTNIGLDGNGKNINGSASGTLYREGTAIDYFYFIDTDEWFAK